MDNEDLWNGQGNCLIYSFGISTDWSFEDALDELGCQIYAFDPTVNYPARRGNNIFFEALGLSDDNEKENYFTLKTILQGMRHLNRNINYLKVYYITLAYTFYAAILLTYPKSRIEESIVQ